MKPITEKQLLDAFERIGLQHGDTVLVHSDLRVFGMPDHLQAREEILRFYQEAFQKTLGEEGTLAVPAYYYEYARFGKDFDVDHSPVSMELGSFSQWINEQPNRIRSCNPLQSIAAIGKRAHELCGSESLSGYGVSSPWNRLRIMNGKILFLGAPFQSMTFVHYIEQHYGVPHLYFKIYPYPVIKSGKPMTGHPISAVRYLDYSVQYELARFQKRLEKAGALRSYEINGSNLLVVNAEDAFQIGISCLDKDPNYFLKHPPKFVEGKIPIDGIR